MMAFFTLTVACTTPVLPMTRLSGVPMLPLNSPSMRSVPLASTLPSNLQPWAMMDVCPAATAWFSGSFPNMFFLLGPDALRGMAHRLPDRPKPKLVPSAGDVFLP